MYSFRTLGALELRSPDGKEQDGVLSGSKLVALLAYLAVATPRGLHRRDSIVALLWPELDQERARAALRHSVYRLRRSLGADALVNRGDEEIAIDPAIVRCDAVAFEELLAAGSVAEALAIYQGDLLPGFFISGAPEFERWLDGARTRLRGRASAAAWQYATERVRDGHRDEAATWARRALAFAPDDEQMLRRVVTLLAEGGDTAGALREYESFAQRLASEYEAKPSAETTAIVDHLRRPAAPVRPPPGAPGAASRGAAGSAGAQDGAADPGFATAPASPPPADGAATPRTRAAAMKSFWSGRRPILRAAITVAALAAITLASLGIRRVVASPPTTSTIAVLPFEVRGSDDLDYLREGMIDLLSITLDGVGGLQSADPRAVIGVDRRAQAAGAHADEDAARRVAEQLGARLYVTGSVVEAGGKLTLTATLHESDGSARATARTRTDEVARLFDLVDELARQLLAGEVGPQAEIARLAGRTTRSVPALRAFLEGEHAIRSGRHAAALESFQQAVSEDSTFALAYYRLGAAGRWLTDYALADDAAEKAARYGSALPSYARRLLTAAHAIQRGDYAEAESLYEAGITSRPLDVDAWFGLGDLFYHYNALRGRSKGEGVAAFERALAIDPEDGQSRLHLLELSVWEGNVTKVDTLMERLDPSSDFVAKWPFVRALLSRDLAAEAKEASRLRLLEDRPLVRVVIHSASTFPSNLAGATRVLDLLTDPARSTGWRAYGHHLRAQVELARGRWAAARGDLTAMGALEPAAATEFGALLSVAPFLPRDPVALGALRAALAGWDAAPTPPSANSVFALHNGAHAQLRLYLLGLVNVRMGDTAAALRLADSLGAATADSTRRLLFGNLANGIRARVAQARGDPHAALALLGRPWLDPRTHASHRSSLFSQVAERYLYAELLRESGRLAEALDAYGAVADYSVDGLMYLAHSHLRRAEIYERMGDQTKARQHYRRFVELWSDCDPELRPLREAAARKLRGG